MKFQKTLALGLVVILLTGLVADHAVWGNPLEDSLNDFLNQARSNVTPSGIYQGQKRGYLVGGNYSFRPSWDKEPLFLYTPPRFRGGCSGIDLSLGSFSYISFDRLVQKLKNAATSFAYGFVIGMAYAIPTVNHIMQYLEKALNQINAMAKNSCQAGVALGKSFGESTKDMISQKYASWTNSGETDATQANTKSVAGLNTLLANTPDGTKTIEANLVWKALQTLNIDDDMRQAIMSLVGTLVIRVDPSADNNTGAPTKQAYPPLLSIEDILYAFATNSQQYTCDELIACLNPTQITYTRQGYLSLVRTVLFGIQDTVRQNGTGMTLQQTDISFIESTRLPIHPLVEWSLTLQDENLEHAAIGPYAEAIALDILEVQLQSINKALKPAFDQADPNIVQGEVQQFIDTYRDRHRDLTQQITDRKHDLERNLNTLRKDIDDFKAKFQQQLQQRMITVRAARKR